MRAYVFWHYPRSGTAISTYEDRLRQFHAALRSAEIDGLYGSYAFAIQQAPWLMGHPAYEDWYVIRDSAALDIIEIHSVSGPMEQPHTAVASLAGGGIAGLYKPVRDPTDLAAASATWFPKPDSVGYGAMHKKLTDIDDRSPSRLWQRVLTLGPTPEFCLLGSGADHLPYEWKHTLIARRPLLAREDS